MKSQPSCSNIPKAENSSVVRNVRLCFFSSRRRHARCLSDWSSDVCSSDLGLRGILAYEVTDRNGEIGMMEGVDESVEFINLVNKDKKENPSHHLVEAAFGGHAPFTLNNHTLKLISEKLKGTQKGIHFHVAEDQYDVSYSHHHFGKDIMKRLEDANLLNNKAILVHGVYLNDNDINIINDHDRSEEHTSELQSLRHL